MSGFRCDRYPCSTLENLRVETHDGVEVHVGFRPTQDEHTRRAYNLYGAAFAVRHDLDRTAAATDYVALGLTEVMENATPRLLDDIVNARTEIAQRSCVRLVLAGPKWWDEPSLREADAPPS